VLAIPIGLELGEGEGKRGKRGNERGVTLPAQHLGFAFPVTDDGLSSLVLALDPPPEVTGFLNVV
jgi:hypothetical protein